MCVFLYKSKIGYKISIKAASTTKKFFYFDNEEKSEK